MIVGILLVAPTYGFFVSSSATTTILRCPRTNDPLLSSRSDDQTDERSNRSASADAIDRPTLSKTELEQRAVSLTALLDASHPPTQRKKVYVRPPHKETAATPPYQTKKKKRRQQAWNANYHTSVATQTKIKAIAHQTANAKRILSYILSIPPQSCNAANLVCAMTLASKNLKDNDSIRYQVQQMADIVLHLLTERQSYVFSTRQLANLAWSLAKFRGEGGIVIPDELIDAIAVALTDSLRNDHSNATQTQELCMSCWAYGILRKRQRPTGWQETPTISSDILLSAELMDEGVEFFGFDGEYSQEEDDSGENEADDELTSTEMLLDEIALALADGRIGKLQWKELANVAWSYATIGRSRSEAVQPLLKDIAQEATNRLLNNTMTGTVQSRDIAQLVWSLGVLQADNYRLGDNFTAFVAAVSEQVAHGRQVQDVMHWSCADIVQTALSLAHARLDEQVLLLRLYTEATARLMSSTMNHAPARQVERKLFHQWELSVLLWVQARLYLTGQLSDVYAQFTLIAMKDLEKAMKAGKSLSDQGIGSQERANIAWSLAVLDCWQSPSAQTIIKSVFDEATMDCKDQNQIQLDHAHQLWQALAILEPLCPECFVDVPSWFRSYLEHEWKQEKARPKQSSARHKALSTTLELMGVEHLNEHDEDIDVAIVLKPQASWTHETVRGEMLEGVKVAVEFDGPAHYTREKPDADPPRTLGHTVLKYRLLKQAGWSVVRVPYFVFDRIPFWASMERQRYVQRLLKTHGNIRFSDVDVSEYKAHIPNRRSRFD